MALHIKNSQSAVLPVAEETCLQCLSEMCVAEDLMQCDSIWQYQTSD